jgi:hypothetical protein
MTIKQLASVSFPINMICPTSMPAKGSDEEYVENEFLA